MARPKKDKNELLSKQISIRFTESDFLKIEKFAIDTSGNPLIDIAYFYRNIILKTANNERIIVKKKENQNYTKFLLELNKIGVNLNQIAKITNSNKTLPNPITEENIKKIQDIITKISYYIDQA